MGVTLWLGMRRRDGVSIFYSNLNIWSFSLFVSGSPGNFTVDFSICFHFQHFGKNGRGSPSINAWSGKPVINAWSGKPVDKCMVGEARDVCMVGEARDVCMVGEARDVLPGGGST